MNGASVGTNTEPSAAMLAFSFLVGAFRNADNVGVYAYDIVGNLAVGLFSEFCS